MSGEFRGAGGSSTAVAALGIMRTSREVEPAGDISRMIAVAFDDFDSRLLQHLGIGGAVVDDCKYS